MTCAVKNIGESPDLSLLLLHECLKSSHMSPHGFTAGVLGGVKGPAHTEDNPSPTRVQLWQCKYVTTLYQLRYRGSSRQRNIICKD